MILGIVLALAMAAHLVIMAAVYALGRNHVRAGFARDPARSAGPRDEFGPDAPSVALLVPLTGDFPGMREALSSLLDQDYPHLRTVFVTRDAADPATPLIQGLMAGRENSRHILAGPATTCGQKNHNLLAAVREVGDTADVLAFCDSTHLAPPFLLRELLRPMIREGALLTSGFHRVIAEDLRTGTLGMLLSAQTVHLLQALPALNQPWGGAMAVRRRVFEEHDVAGLWSTNIVDDFSMGPHLVRKGIRCKGVARACLLTPLSGRTVSQWFDWWTRQLYYLKFCMFWAWVGVMALYALFLGPVLHAPLAVAGWLAGWWPGAVAASAGVYLLGLVALGFWSRSFVPARIPVLAWFRAYFAYFPVSAACYVRTGLSNVMSWRGISYRVGRGGVVREILVRDQAN